MLRLRELKDLESYGRSYTCRVCLLVVMFVRVRGGLSVAARGLCAQCTMQLPSNARHTASPLWVANRLQGEVSLPCANHVNILPLLKIAGWPSLHVD